MKVDKSTYHILLKVILNAYLLTHKNIGTTGYTKEEFEELDKRYKDKQEGYFNDYDTPIIIKGLEWMIGNEGVDDDTDLLDINRQQAFRLVALLKNGANQIESKDWL